MCISPIRIKNPYYGVDPSTALNRLKDCTSAYINVPCGHCIQCIARKQSDMTQRVFMETLDSYMYFGTLTYNNESLPKVVSSTGEEFSYADPQDVQKMFKRIRKIWPFPDREFKYMFSSERGSKRGRPHFHFVLLVKKLPTDEHFIQDNIRSVLHPFFLSNWVRNYGSKRNPDYRPLCTFKEIIYRGKIYHNYDFQSIVPRFGNDSIANVTYYVTKYCLKSCARTNKLKQYLYNNYEPDEFRKLWQLVKDKNFKSLGFGIGNYSRDNRHTELQCNDNILNHLRKSVQLSYDSDFPQFLHPETGKAQPLARYYKGIADVYHLDDALHFHDKSPYLDNYAPTDADLLKASTKKLSQKTAELANYFEKNDDIVCIFDEDF